MNKMLTLILPVFALLLALPSQAKTVTYDMRSLSTFPGAVHYERLDFINATSAVITITKTLGVEPIVNSLVVNFPAASRMNATNFKKLDNGRYRAIIQGAWIYKEVLVDIDAPTLEIGFPFNFTVSVSERTAYINPQVESQGSILFFGTGMPRDITPTRIADSQRTTLDGKAITLSLRDRITEVEDSVTGRRVGFLVNTSWQGNGLKDIILGRSLVDLHDMDSLESVALIVEQVPGSSSPTVRVKYREISTGIEFFTNPESLKTLLTAQ